VNTNRINSLDFETSTLQGADIVGQGSRGVGTGEDVFVHEKTPDEILILPWLSQPSNLKEEDTVVVQHLVTLSQETSQVSNTNVLGHLETGDFVIFSFRDGDITIIHAENLALLFGNASLSEAVVTPGSLVATKSDTGSLGAEVDTGKFGKGSPSATDIQHLFVLLESNFLADNGHLVILQLFEGFLLVNIGNDTGCVDHAWAKEPSIEIITAVVVVTDLLLICREKLEKIN